MRERSQVCQNKYTKGTQPRPITQCRCLICLHAITAFILQRGRVVAHLPPSSAPRYILAEKIQRASCPSSRRSWPCRFIRCANPPPCPMLPYAFERHADTRGWYSKPAFGMFIRLRFENSQHYRATAASRDTVRRRTRRPGSWARMHHAAPRRHFVILPTNVTMFFARHFARDHHVHHARKRN